MSKLTVSAADVGNRCVAWRRWNRGCFNKLLIRKMWKAHYNELIIKIPQTRGEKFNNKIEKSFSGKNLNYGLS